MPDFEDFDEEMAWLNQASRQEVGAWALSMGVPFEGLSDWLDGFYRNRAARRPALSLVPSALSVVPAPNVGGLDAWREWRSWLRAQHSGSEDTVRNYTGNILRLLAETDCMAPSLHQRDAHGDQGEGEGPRQL